MIEKLWSAVAPVQLTASGNSRGLVTVTSTIGFKVKMAVTISDGSNAQLLEIKRIVGPNQMFLGEKGDIKLRSDLSAFSPGSIIWALEQPRNSIPLQEIDRAIYEEEPAVALRTISVDPYGSPYSSSNPVPTINDSFWDEINLERDIDGDITKATFKKSDQIIKVLDLTYDLAKDLSKVKKT